MKKYSLLTCFLLCLVNFGLRAQKLSKPVAVSPSESFYTNPLWSPNGKYLICTGQNSLGVYLLEVKKKTIKKLNELRGAGYGYAWSPDSKKIFYKEIPEGGYASQAVAKSIDIVSGKIEVHAEINHNAIPSTVDAKNGSDPVVYTNLKNLKIYAETQDGKAPWEITKEEGQYYNAILSPDKKYVVVHRNEKILLYPIAGGNAIRELGTGIASSWSPDSKFLLSFIDESPDGHQISNSDLYLISIQDAKTRKLTNTTSMLEMRASFSPDGKRIAYADEESGRIFISKITY